jgi:hypothetical protein
MKWKLVRATLRQKWEMEGFSLNDSWTVIQSPLNGWDIYYWNTFRAHEPTLQEAKITARKLWFKYK